MLNQNCLVDYWIVMLKSEKYKILSTFLFQYYFNDYRFKFCNTISSVKSWPILVLKSRTLTVKPQKYHRHIYLYKLNLRNVFSTMSINMHCTFIQETCEHIIINIINLPSAMPISNHYKKLYNILLCMYIDTRRFCKKGWRIYGIKWVKHGI